MKCPFCYSQMINLSTFFLFCRHEDELIIVESFLGMNPFELDENEKKSISICKDGFEIIFSDNYTQLYKYDPINNPEHIFFHKGFVYDGGDFSKNLVKVDCKLSVSPSNFNYFKNKLLSLIPFS